MSALFGLARPVAYVSLPLYMLHKASEASPLARYYIRLGLYLGTLGLCSCWGMCVAVGMSLVGRKLDVNWVIGRSFYALGGRALGISFKVEGEEHITDPGGAVLVGNHQSMLDILYLGRIFPHRASIMGKKELQWTPLLGQYMTLSGAVFVDRRNNARAVQSLRAAADAVRVQAMSLWMFPEGTRSMRAESDMLPFKKGAFHLAVQAGVPIIPVVCENYWRLYRQGVFESGVLTIRVLPPIPTAGMKEGEVGALANRVREAMVTALREISEPAPDAGAAPPASASGARATSPPAEPRTVIDERVTPKPSTPPAPSSSSVASSISIPPSPAPSDSHESIASSTASLAGRRRPESDAGFETEEDEGMVLVGRPPR